MYVTKTGKVILGGLGLLVAWNLFSKGAAAYSLNFSPGRVKSFDWNGIRPVINLELQVQNTSNHSFNVLSIAGNVYMTTNGKEYLVGTVTDFAPMTIAPISQSVVPLALSLQLTGVVSDLLSVFQSGLSGQTVRLSAFANVDQLQVPLNYTYNL